MAGRLQLAREAERIEAEFRVSRIAGRQTLRAMLDQPRRLHGEERTLALDFNARLVTLLRERDAARPAARKLMIWGDAR